MAIKIEKIGGTGECEVSGGFSHTEVYVALLDHFQTLTEPKTRCSESKNPAESLADLVTITTPHTFKDGFGFTKVKAIAETVKLESTQIGDVNKSPAIENKLTFQLLGSKAEILGFKRMFKGRDVIVLAVEYASGQIRQIGSSRFGGKFKEMSALIDGTVEGENTSTIVVSDKQNYDAPIYSGTITTQAA
ncbi:MAG: hypothetical protein KGV59_01480 [Tenacibaculum sp.]|nr:hypothetical protein [Tenacibaculum sp.]